MIQTLAKPVEMTYTCEVRDRTELLMLNIFLVINVTFAGARDKTPPELAISTLFEYLRRQTNLSNDCSTEKNP